MMQFFKSSLFLPPISSVLAHFSATERIGVDAHILVILMHIHTGIRAVLDFLDLLPQPNVVPNYNL